MTDTKKSAKSTSATAKRSAALSDAELAALKETVQERKRAARRGAKGDKEHGESDALAKIAEMQEPDRSMAERIHAIVKASAPELSPKTWYGMPAYANADGKVVCFFQSGQKYDSRYSTFGFQDAAKLDDGAIWAASFAVKEMTPAVETKIAALVKKAAR